MIVVFFGGCIAIVVGTSKAIKDVAQKEHTVTYAVSGSGTTTADITYDTLQEGGGQNGEAQLTNEPLPWSKTITASGLITSYDVTVTNGSVGLLCRLHPDRGRQGGEHEQGQGTIRHGELQRHELRTISLRKRNDPRHRVQGGVKPRDGAASLSA